MIARLWDRRTKKPLAELDDDRQWHSADPGIQARLTSWAPARGGACGDPRFVQAGEGAELLDARLEMLIRDPDDGLPAGTVY